MISEKKISPINQLLFATDAKTVEAIKNDDYKNLGLLPRDLWEWKLIRVGGCKMPRRKKK